MGKCNYWPDGQQGDDLREKTCEICGGRFVSGALEGRKICLMCERKAVEKFEIDKKK